MKVVAVLVARVQAGEVAVGKSAAYGLEGDVEDLELKRSEWLPGKPSREFKGVRTKTDTGW